MGVASRARPRSGDQAEMSGFRLEGDDRAAYSFATTFSIRSCPTSVSIRVVAMLSWPSGASMSARSAPASSGLMA